MIALAPAVLKNSLGLTNENELKEQFARLLIKYPDNVFYAAKLLFEPNISLCLQIARDWPKDELVISIKNRILIGADYKMLLASKADVAQDVHKIASNELTHTEYRLKGYELFAKMMGYVEKEGATINNVNNVMVVKDHGSNDEWETKLLEQQNKLCSPPTTT